MSSSSLTRVAVAQLDFHPAARVAWGSPLEDPLFALDASSHLLPADGLAPKGFEERLQALAGRVRTTYLDNQRRKLLAILGACVRWGVRLLVLPEYSVPWELLTDLARAAGDMVVVAGTHAVEPGVAVYDELGWGARPARGTAVCPVLHQGRIVALQPKLRPAAPEQRAEMRLGERWAPIKVEGLPDFGVLICLDFLFRESPTHQGHVRGQLDLCRFLAVPSLTPFWTEGEFGAKGWEEARRYKRPVLWSNDAGGGGSTIYVDEGAPADLARFPERAGLLERGVEGLVVADVDLGYARPGPSQSYAGAVPIRAFAQAGLVYAAQPQGAALARWLGEQAQILERDDDEALDLLVPRVRQARGLLLDAAARVGASQERRTRQLLQRLDNLVHVEELRRFTRDVVLPVDVLPHTMLRAAMAHGAAEAVWALSAEERAQGMHEVEHALREGGKAAGSVDAEEWTEAGRGEIRRVIEVVQGAKPKEVVTPPAVPLAELEPTMLGEREIGGFQILFRRKPSELRAGLHLKALRRNGFDPAGSPILPRFFRRRDDESELVLTTDDIELMHGQWLALAANDCERICTLVTGGVDERRQTPGNSIGILARHEDQWWLFTQMEERQGEHAAPDWRAVAQALSSVWSPLEVKFPTRERLRDYARDLLPRVSATPQVIAERRERILADVDQHYVEVSVRLGEVVHPGTEALQRWVHGAGPASALLLLGSFGSGKSTLLAQWAHLRWLERDWAPKPLLVNLAETTPAQDPWDMLAQAARLDPTPANKAALELMMNQREIMAIFDGFDEMATRVSQAELAGRLRALLAVAEGGGTVILSSRDSYFGSEDELGRTLSEALANAAVSVERAQVRPFEPAQIEALVWAIRGQDAPQALNKISSTYDLQDLVTTPLLLAMVLRTVDRLRPGVRVGQADIYEAYLRRWLENTHQGPREIFTDDQKIAFAEALAEQIWRSGSVGLSITALRESVRARLSAAIPDEFPRESAYFEVQGGAFFVREETDRFRFAHKSFLEFFLARSLVATLAERPGAALDTRTLTPEIAAFLYDLLRREGDPGQSAALTALNDWLVHRTDPERSAASAANALRLLRDMQRHAQSSEPAVPEGALLPGVRMVSEDLQGLRLIRADLQRAELRGGDLRGMDLSGASLRGAILAHARLDHARLVEADLRDAELCQVEADQVDLEGADLRGADLSLSAWTEGLDHATPSQVVGAWEAPGPRRLGAWDPPTAIQLGLLRRWHRGRVWSVSWSPDGARVLSGGDDGTVRVWDAATGQQRARLDGHEGSVGSVSWSPDGQRVLSGGEDGTVRVWDAATGQQRARLDGHEGRVLSVSWSPDGQRVLSGGDDGTVRVWDAATGQERARLDGHEWSVLSVSWSPDGERVLSGGDDGTVRVWDAATGQERARLDGHEGSVLSVSWSPDGERVLSGGDDGTVRVWDAARGSLVVTLYGLRMGWLTTTPLGWFSASDPDARWLLLEVPVPGSAGSVLYTPLAGLRRLLHRPDLVAEALAGRPVPDARLVLEAHGWRFDRPWDGSTGAAPLDAPASPALPIMPQEQIGAVTSSPPLRFFPGRALAEVEALPGRADIVAEILDLLDGRCPVALLGPRRAGKTSLLNLLARRLGGRALRRSLEGPPPRSADDLARRLAGDLADRPAPAALLLERWRSGEPPVLLLDELGYLREADAGLFAWLRAAGQEAAAVLLAGSHADWRQVLIQASRTPGASFGNDYTALDLGPLPEADAVRFFADAARACLADKAVENVDATARWVIELVGTWPYYLQVLGHALVQDVRADRRLALVERRGVIDLYERRLMADPNEVLMNRWRELPAEVRARLLSLLQAAESRSLPLLSDLGRAAREELERVGLIHPRAGWLDDRPFWDWLRRNLGRLEA